MACNCGGKSRGSLDDASVNFLMDLVKQTPNENGELMLLDTSDPFISSLVDIIMEKAQYLNEAGLEYLIMMLRRRYVERDPDKGLSSNDFTDELKDKLDALPTNKELQDKLNSINSADWQVVSSLPEKGKPGVIYLVPLDDQSDSKNQYAEYIWVNDGWELLGIFGISGNGLVTQITMNGSTHKPNASGVLALGGVVIKVKFNGSTYSVNSSGVVDIGSVAEPDLSDYMPKSGGTFTGDVRFQTGGKNYGSVVNMGDGDYVHFKEDTDDHLEIYAAKGINLKTGGSYTVTINGTDLDEYIESIAGSAGDGSYLPLAGGVMTGDIYMRGTSKVISFATTDANRLLQAIQGGTTTDPYKIIIRGAPVQFICDGSGKSSSAAKLQLILGNTSVTNISDYLKRISMWYQGASASYTLYQCIEDMLSSSGGNAIHTGTTEPASTLGSNGDFYYKMK